MRTVRTLLCFVKDMYSACLITWLCTDSPLQDCCTVILITSKHPTHSNTGTIKVAESSCTHWFPHNDPMHGFGDECVQYYSQPHSCARVSIRWAVRCNQFDYTIVLEERVRTVVPWITQAVYLLICSHTQLWRIWPTDHVNLLRTIRSQHMTKQFIYFVGILVCGGRLGRAPGSSISVRSISERVIVIHWLHLFVELAMPLTV